MPKDKKTVFVRRPKLGWWSGITIIMLLVPATPALAINGDPLCGVISEDGYHQITNQAQLAAVGSGLETDDADCRLDATYRLMNDISLVGEWTPLPGVPEFSGEFDGNNRTLKDLVVTTGLTETVSGYTFTTGGLFSRIKGASIYDLTIEGASIQLEGTHDAYVGALSGISNGADGADPRRTSIDGVMVKQSALTATTNRSDGAVFVGGLIGYAASLDVNDAVVDSTEIAGEARGSGFDYVAAGGIVGGGVEEGLFTGVSVRETSVEAVAETPSGDVFAGGLVSWGSNFIIRDAVVDTTQVRSSGGRFAFSGGIIAQLFAEVGENSQLVDVTVICSDIEAVSSDGVPGNFSAVAGGLVAVMQREADPPRLTRFPDPETYMIYRGRVFGEGSVRASSAGSALAGGLAGVVTGIYQPSKPSADRIVEAGVFASGVYGMTVETRQLSPAQDELHRAGGLVGLLEEADIDASLVKDTTVSGEYLFSAEPRNLRVGGFVGEAKIGDVFNSYVAGGSASGSVPDAIPARIGGFVGLVESRFDESTQIFQNYANLISTPQGGEFFGETVGPRSIFFYSIFRDDINGFSELPDPYDELVPIGFTRDAMRILSLFEDELFWFITGRAPSVENAWWGISDQINDGFPYLYWEIEDSFSILGCSNGCGDDCGGERVATSGQPNSVSFLAATGHSPRLVFLGLALALVGCAMLVLARWLPRASGSNTVFLRR